METDFIKSLGLIGYTARIRRLNDSLMNMGKEVYKNLELNIEPNWHLILLLLEIEKELTATEIAHHLHFTHTAIIKIAKRMVDKGYLKSSKSKKDNRKQLYTLSPLAKKELPRIKENLNLIAKVHSQYVSPEFIEALDQIESSLEEKNTVFRVNEILGKEFPISKHLNLKPVSIEDHPTINLLMQEIYSQTYSYLWTDKGVNYLNQTYAKEQFQKELADKNGRYFLIHFKNKAIGILRYILHKNRKNNEEKNTLQIQRLYLHNQVQGKGFGTQILAWVLNSHTNYNTWLEVMDSQDGAVKFYERLGFEIIDKTQIQSKNIIPRYKGQFVMQKSKK